MTEREIRLTRVRESARAVASDVPDTMRTQLLGSVIESLCDDLEIAYKVNEDLRAVIRDRTALVDELKGCH